MRRADRCSPQCREGVGGGHAGPGVDSFNCPFLATMLLVVNTCLEGASAHSIVYVSLALQCRPYCDMLVVLLNQLAPKAPVPVLECVRDLIAALFAVDLTGTDDIAPGMSEFRLSEKTSFYCGVCLRTATLSIH